MVQLLIILLPKLTVVFHTMPPPSSGLTLGLVPRGGVLFLLLMMVVAVPPLPPMTVLAVRFLSLPIRHLSARLRWFNVQTVARVRLAFLQGLAECAGHGLSAAAAASVPSTGMRESRERKH